MDTDTCEHLPHLALYGFEVFSIAMRAGLVVRGEDMSRDLSANGLSLTEYTTNSTVEGPTWHNSSSSLLPKHYQLSDGNPDVPSQALPVFHESMFTQI